MSTTIASKGVLAIVVIAMLFCIGWIENGQASKKTTWEYKVVEMSSSKPDEEINKMLNQSGANGWELAQADQAEGGLIYFYFKRAR